MPQLTKGYWRGLHYRYLDGGGDIGILLSHPMALNVRWVEKTMVFLAEQGFKVWALDLPGHGKSRGHRIGFPCLRWIPILGKIPWAVDFDLQEAGAMVLEFGKYIKEEKGLQYLVGCGLSFGGIVLSVALGQDLLGIFDTALVQCYVTRKEDLRVYENTPRMINLTRKLAESRLGAAPVIFFIKMSTPLKEYFIHIGMSLKTLLMVGKWSIDPNTAFFFSKRALVSLHYAETVPDSQVRICLIAPEKDAMFYDYAKILVKRLPNAEIWTIPDALHSVFVNGEDDRRKKKLAEEMAGWIRQNVPK